MKIKIISSHICFEYSCNLYIFHHIFYVKTHFKLLYKLILNILFILYRWEFFKNNNYDYKNCVVIVNYSNSYKTKKS